MSHPTWFKYVFSNVNSLILVRVLTMLKGSSFSWENAKIIISKKWLLCLNSWRSAKSSTYNLVFVPSFLLLIITQLDSKFLLIRPVWAHTKEMFILRLGHTKYLDYTGSVQTRPKIISFDQSVSLFMCVFSVYFICRIEVNLMLIWIL